MLANAAIVVFLYFSLDGLLVSWGVRFEPAAPGLRGPLPNLPILEQLFAIHAVFDRYSDQAFGFSARGVPAHAAAEREAPTFVEIDLERYFPQSRGDAYRRLQLWAHASSDRPALYARLAGQLRRLHNADHPEAPVEKVFIYRHRWPKSLYGYAYWYAQRDSEIVGHD